ncbi:hypothetical protein FNL39_104515 [Nocardia caishijiensis]|uniref:Plastocyanin-like domain-containing protein n=1 Tax=Nocardia caishijiensis TaxID=184756 RepID=A0ABQ6YMS6_9NOCA|nr:hypothetical protein FNL39_104515 [Nocardia caishijiensis]
MRVDGHHGTEHADRQSDDLRGYVWHCHLLDHEDHDMMLRDRIVS